MYTKTTNLIFYIDQRSTTATIVHQINQKIVWNMN